MVFKDKLKQKEANKEANRRYRKKVSREGITEEGITSYFKDGIEMVPSSYVPGVRQEFLALPERPRFVTLSDGQGWDRLLKPTATSTLDMRMCNESAYNYHPNKVPGISKVEQSRVLKKEASG